LQGKKSTESRFLKVLRTKRNKLLADAGFKDSEIVIVNGFTKSGGARSDSRIEKEVSQAMEKFNNGAYKILIGSTACIGEGLNLQENSAALHHCPAFPPPRFPQILRGGQRLPAVPEPHKENRPKGHALPLLERDGPGNPQGRPLF
jgi:hypothetical protein